VIDFPYKDDVGSCRCFRLAVTKEQAEVVVHAFRDDILESRIYPGLYTCQMTMSVYEWL
jgi:hypothetical protein